MRSFFKKLLWFVIIILLALISFVYWASSPKLGNETYIQKVRFGDLTDRKTDSIFTIVTYNIGYLSGMTNNLDLPRSKEMFNSNLERVETGFDKYNPDFIALQEVDFGGSRAYQVNQFENLAKKLGFYEGGMAVNWDKNYVPFPYSISTANHFGNVLSGQGVLSKYPISKHEVSTLERPDNPIWYDLFYIDRLAQVVEVELGMQKIYIINVHLEAYDKETRQKQSDVVLEMYEKLAKEQPTLLVGDFNSEAVSEGEKDRKPTVNTFLEYENLVSACPESSFGSPNSLTYPSDSPKQQIDYIFYDSTKFESLKWEVIKEVETSSDHLPLLMQFRLKP